MHPHAILNSPANSLRPFSSITPKKLAWLWPHRIPLAKITLLAGDPGSGKTTLLLDLAARLSRGQSMPPTPLTPQSSALSPPAATLLLSPNDDPADTLHPKLQAAGANLNHIHLLEDFHSLIPNIAPGSPGEITPLQTLDAALSAIPNLSLLIIDPITHFLGLSDRLLPTNLKAQGPQSLGSSRSILHALSRLAQKHNIAIILTTRLTKKIDPTLSANSLHRTLGSLAFASSARSVFLLTHIPQNTPLKSETPPTHLLLPLKSNLIQTPLPLPLTIEGTITYHAEQSLPPPPPKSRGPAALSAEAAAHWLQNALADGPLLAAQLTKDAYANAISRSTLDRARQLANIESIKQDYSSRWFWQLPGDSRPLPEDPIEKQFFQMFHPKGGAPKPEVLGQKSHISKTKPEVLAQNPHIPRRKPEVLPQKQQLSPQIPTPPKPNTPS